MCTDHPVDGSYRRPTAARSDVRATRRRFLVGGAGALAGTIGLGMLSGTAGAEESTTDDGAAADEYSEANAEDGSSDSAVADGSSAISIPRYLNRPAWGADESLRRNDKGEVDYPVEFFPVQKITVHHSASWTPWSDDDSTALVQAIYDEHVLQEFGDIGYHLMIDPLGTVYEGRYSGGTRFPIYDLYPSEAVTPGAVNAAHTFHFNAGNIGIALLGDYESNDISDEAWWALKTTVAMICVNTGLDPLGESLYRNPINGIEAVLPNVLPHRTAAGTLCPGESVVSRFEELREAASALLPRLAAETWLA